MLIVKIKIGDAIGYDSVWGGWISDNVDNVPSWIWT